MQTKRRFRPRALAILVAGMASIALPLRASGPTHDESYRSTAKRILSAERESGKAFELLQHLTDSIGPRLTGSIGAEAAITWARDVMRGEGLDVRLEPVTAPHWVRDAEQGEIISPHSQRLALTALGGSVSTGDGRLTADVVEVASFEQLAALGSRVQGKIVLFNDSFLPSARGEGYARLSPLRTRGAIEAARLGAVGSLVRSLGTLSARLPHTGLVQYEAGVPKIPAAALSAEDADLLHRLLASGANVSVRLRLACRTLPDVQSANVLAELRGREVPDEIVLIGAHLDSWDLGTGAIDDGAGVAMVIEALRLLKVLGLVPRRTIRGVLFTAEENGLAGSLAYAAAHRLELPRHVAAVEMDSGAANLIGFEIKTGPGGKADVGRIAELIDGLSAASVWEDGHFGADIAALGAAGVPLIGPRQDSTHYFDWHHTAADTLDKVVPEELAQNSAALAILAYVLADSPERLPSPAQPSGAGH